MIYANRIDAERAMKRYNNVQLDGKPMAVRSAALCTLRVVVGVAAG